VSETKGFIPPTEEIPLKSDPTVPAAIAGSLREFLNALRTGQTPQGECHDNIKSLAMVFAAIESARTGNRVEIAV
jgi:predicted dehydrogenase